MIRTSRSAEREIDATPRQLEEQLIYHKDASGSYDVTVTDYWDRVVCRVLPAYSSYSFSRGSSRVVCPFHDDVAPSLGLIRDKSSGVEIFHCFGCGVKGTVVQFHRLFFSKYKGFSNRDGRALLGELAKIYGISLRLRVKDSEVSAPVVDYNKPVPYTSKKHRDNIRKLTSAFRGGQIDIAQFRSNLDKLTDRVVQSRSGG